MAEIKGPIKQIACGRRKPNMTRKEFVDHRFQVHGSLSQGPSADASPHKYIQTAIFDSAYGARAGGLNLNHPWAFRDDVSEMTFRDLSHMQTVFSSEHVRRKIGPDAPLFADFEVAISMLAIEHPMSLPASGNSTPVDGGADVAIYFLSSKASVDDRAALREKVDSLLLQSLSLDALGELYHAEVNVAITLPGLDLTKYFGGEGMPEYAFVYKLFLKNVKSVPYIRKAQKSFEALAGDLIDFSESFIVFGKEQLVLDYGKGLSFDPKRQAVFDEAGYAQSLSHLST